MNSQTTIGPACFMAFLFGVLAAPACPGQQPTLPRLSTFHGDSPNAYYGLAARGVGDVNADGYPDMAIGSLGDDAWGLDAGKVEIRSGFDGSPIYTLYGDSAFDYFGNAVDGAGDVNNDGYADFVIGSQGDDGGGPESGAARVYSGSDGSLLYTWFGTGGYDQFGNSVAGAGDVNNDGYDDVIVGAATNDTPGFDGGSATVFSGFDGTVLYTFLADGAYDLHGISVDGAGDVNADGYADVVVGAFLDSNTGLYAGMVRVYSGLDGSTLFSIDGDSAGDLLGTAVAGAGDVNLDGHDDFIVGAIGVDDNGTNSGSVRVYSGLDATLLFRFDGDAAQDLFGTAVAGVGDVNLDGYPDLLVGAPFADAGGFQNAGLARLFSGADGALMITYLGSGAGELFGTSVSGLGDVNLNGGGEVLVGSMLGQGPNGAAGTLQVLAVAAARAYGIGQGSAQTIAFDWVEGPTPMAGWLLATGAPSLAPGLIAVSAYATVQALGSATLLVDISSSESSFLLPFNYDASGSFNFPADLRDGPAGASLYAQVIAGDPQAPEGFWISNAIELLFSL